MTKRFADGVVPAAGAQEEAEEVIEKTAARVTAEVDEHVLSLRPQRALESIMGLVDETNRYLERREPWKAAKDPDRASQVPTTLYTCCESLRITAVLLSAFLPQTSQEILSRLGVENALQESSLQELTQWGGLEAGLPTIKGAPLFPRVDVPEESE